MSDEFVDLVVLGALMDRGIVMNWGKAANWGSVACSRKIRVVTLEGDLRNLVAEVDHVFLILDGG